MGIFNRKKEVAPAQPEERSYNIGGLFYGSGSNYSKNQALRLSAVFASVSQISNSCSVLPLNIVKESGDERKVIYDHKLRKLLNGKPDTRHTHFNFFKQMVESVLLRGAGYALIVRNQNLEVTQLVYIDSDYVTPMAQEDGSIKYLIAGLKGAVNAEDILDFHMHVDENYKGISVIKYADRALQSAYEADKTALNFFKSGGNLAGILKPSSPMNGEQRKQAAQAWRESFENVNDRIPVSILPFGLDFQSVSVSPEDAELLSTRKYSVEEIARFFNIPTQKLYINSTIKESVEDIQMMYLLDTILPYTQMMKEEMETKLFRPSEVGKFYIEFDFDKLLKTDMKTLASYYKELLTNGIMSPNEVRAKINLEPISEEEGGNAHYLQMSYSTLKNIKDGTLLKNQNQDQTQTDDIDNKMKEKE